MRNVILGLLSAAAITATAAPAFAGLQFIDDYSVSGGVSNVAGTNQPPFSTLGTPNGTTTSAAQSLGTWSRTITATNIDTAPATSLINFQGLSAGGFLTISNSTFDKTAVSYDYTNVNFNAALAGVIAGSSGSFALDLTSSDLTTTYTLLLDGTSLGTVTSPALLPTTLHWGVTAAQLAGTSHTLSLKINGVTAYDVLADNLRVAVPEPASLGLLGLGLAGLGFARRRKA